MNEPQCGNGRRQSASWRSAAGHCSRRRLTTTIHSQMTMYSSAELFERPHHARAAAAATLRDRCDRWYFWGSSADGNSFVWNSHRTPSSQCTTNVAKCWPIFTITFHHASLSSKFASSLKTPIEFCQFLLFNGIILTTYFEITHKLK